MSTDVTLQASVRCWFCRQINHLVADQTTPDAEPRTCRHCDESLGYWVDLKHLARPVSGWNIHA